MLSCYELPYSSLETEVFKMVLYLREKKTKVYPYTVWAQPIFESYLNYMPLCM